MYLSYDGMYLQKVASVHVQRRQERHTQYWYSATVFA